MKKESKPIIKVEAQPLEKPTGIIKAPAGNIFIKTLNIFLVPAKSRYHQFYHPKNRQWFWHLAIDAILIAAVIAMFGLNVFLLTHPATDSIRNYFDQSIFSLNKQPHLSLELIKDRDNIKTGEAAFYTINYKNDGSAEAKEVIIVLNLESGITGDTKKIILDSNKYPELKIVAKGQNGTIKYPMTLNTKLEQPNNPNNYILTAWAEAFYKKGEQSASTLSNKLIQKISTNFNLSALVKYNLSEGDQLGIGPLPPLVGQKTKYWIFLAPETDYNDVADISVTASLPTNVRPTGRVSATSPQPIKFNQEKNQLTWQVDEILAPSNNYSQIGAALEVELLPTNDQIGQPANLLTDIKVSGQDRFTNEVISLNLANLTTNIQEDRTGGLIK